MKPFHQNRWTEYDKFYIPDRLRDSEMETSTQDVHLIIFSRTWDCNIPTISNVLFAANFYYPGVNPTNLGLITSQSASLPHFSNKFTRESTNLWKCLFCSHVKRGYMILHSATLFVARSRTIKIIFEEKLLILRTVSI